MVSHSQQSDNTRHHKAQNSRDAHRHAQFYTYPIGQATKDAGHCINLPMEYYRLVV